MQITEPRPPSVVPRFDGVDLLRGVSILAVVLLHTAIRMHGAGFSLAPLLPPWLYHFLFWNGDNGVTVFFAVSGFLITTTSLRRFGSLAQMRPRVFYRIRFARIAPLLLILLAVLSFLHLIGAQGFHISPQRTTLARALFAALTFHLNWLEAATGYLPANWDVLWSLSVEEMFYFFFPLLCFLLLRRSRGNVFFGGLLIALAVMGPFARTVWAAPNGIWQEKTYLGGMDAIAMGCMSAFAVERLLARGENWRATHRRWLLAMQVAGAALLLWIAVWPSWPPLSPIMHFVGRTGLDGTVLAVGTCLVMIATVLRDRAGSRWTAPVRWFGRHSYEVYMTHEFVVVWGTMLYVLVKWGPLWLWFAGILLLSAPLGALVARYLSEPLNRRFRGAPPPLRSRKHAKALTVD